jgi:hypothetical protein
MTPEGRVKEQVKNLLKEFGVYYHMPVMNGMGAPTLDFICCCNGRYLAIETKAPGKSLTPRQAKTMGEITAAGGTAFMVDDERSLRQLRTWVSMAVNSKEV